MIIMDSSRAESMVGTGLLFIEEIAYDNASTCAKTDVFSIAAVQATYTS
jgi:hypothetical protein